ncbi:hypothetical protein [Roseofilum capinflatum]|uniref:Uncharacterized protein n=1 Tax=Roseofilum capinflatum BLCC-M114 TaxID=3022440 RepID=A0ABT7B7X0_9CYAN|nr:hypothetical protein [Roseofilum capinflatum]MDJ1174892.1 hypothetical protein [Roseofilum capinflatum BLCC-M114]
MAYAKKSEISLDIEAAIDIPAEFEETFTGERPENFPLPAEIFPLNRGRCCTLLGKSAAWMNTVVVKSFATLFDGMPQAEISSKITPAEWQLICWVMHHSYSEIPVRDAAGNIVYDADGNPETTENPHKLTPKQMRKRISELFANPSDTQRLPKGSDNGYTDDSGDDFFNKACNNALTVSRSRKLTASEARQETEINYLSLEHMFDQFEQVLTESIARKMEAITERSMAKASTVSKAVTAKDLGKHLEALTPEAE